MNFYKIIIYLFMLLPIFHLILIGMILRKSSGKISAKLISIFKILTVEIIIFLLSINVPIPDGGIMFYFIIALVIGIPVLIYQFKYYKNFLYDNWQFKMTISYSIWVIAVIIGLIYWFAYYIANPLLG